jgi:putative component of toxin-antitoxin plasmid stabilization module
MRWVALAFWPRDARQPRLDTGELALAAAQRGDTVIVLLCGGDKSTQDDDIATAKRLAKETDNGED